MDFGPAAWVEGVQVQVECGDLPGRFPVVPLLPTQYYRAYQYQRLWRFPFRALLGTLTPACLWVLHVLANPKWQYR